MEPSTQVLVRDIGNNDKVITKAASELCANDVILPNSVVQHIHESSGLMYQLTFDDGTTWTADCNTRILLLVPGNPYIDFDHISNQYNVEYLDKDSRFQKLVVPVAQVARLKWIRQNSHRKHFISLRSLPQLTRSHVSECGLYAHVRDKEPLLMTEYKCIGSRKGVHVFFKLSQDNNVSVSEKKDDIELAGIDCLDESWFGKSEVVHNPIEKLPVFLENGFIVK